MAFGCKERDLKTCKELNGLGLCEIYTNKKGKKECKKISGARDITLDDIAIIRGVVNTKPKSENESVNASPTFTKHPSGPIKPPSPKIKTPSPLKPGSPNLEEDSIMATGIHHTLVYPIFNLNITPIESLEAILNNHYLKDNYNSFLKDLKPELINDSIKFYGTFHSDNFKKLLYSLVEEYPEFSKNLQLQILKVLNNPHIKTKAGPLIYTNIYTSTLEQLEQVREDTSIVLSTSKNVETSEDIERLGIHNYTSILRNFSNFKIYNKSSASSSIVLTGILTPSIENLNSVKARNTLRQGQQFYFKIFPLGEAVHRGKLTQYDTVGLTAEYKIYTELFKLIKYNVTPNILCKVAAEELSYFTTDFMNHLPRELKVNIDSEMKRINIKINIQLSNKWENTGLTVTMPGGLTISDVFPRLTHLERKQFMFQLLYTLYIFDKLQISHGDLHSGNMFIVDVEPTELCYLVEGIQYRFTTTKILKIYDFDHSMIGKDTNVKLDINNRFRIDKIVNADRNKGEFFDIVYGECSIYNKNLDLVISIINGFAFHVQDITKLDVTNGRDKEFEKLLRDILPGMDKNNSICKETIIETYGKSFKDIKNIREAQAIFDMPMGEMANWVEREVLSLTWGEYFNKTKKKLGRIVKSFNYNPNTNHLWIPDNVIIPKIDMLRNTYFSEFISTTSINVRNSTIYTIDNRLL
jgi:hypothetical protein